MAEAAVRMAARAETLRAASNRVAARLAAAGIATAQLDARLLVQQAARCSHEQFIVDATRLLGAGQSERLAGLLARRLAGEPVARILGEKEFWGRNFRLSAETLVPRPDSEILVEAGLNALRAAGAARPAIADLGTGSGCLLVSLLAEWPTAVGVGVDLSADALATAARNAERHGVGRRALFVQANWQEPLAEKAFHLIVANPPYICSGEIAALAPEVAAFDPRRALDGGADGLDAIRAIAKGVARNLKSGAVLLVEVGEGQAGAVRKVFAEAGLSDGGEGGILRDLAGRERVVRAVAAH